MVDATATTADTPRKSSKIGLLIGVLLAIVGGGGGYYVTSSGLLGGPHDATAEKKSSSKDVAFIPMDQMTISIGDPTEQRFLRFRAELEVSTSYESDVKKLMPRVVDVLNTYLRSVELADLEDPSSLLTLRSQMRRRIDLVVGGDKVHDLLVMEFVIN